MTNISYLLAYVKGKETSNL